MAQLWPVYVGMFFGFLMIVALVLFFNRRDTLIYKQLWEIRTSQVELLRKFPASEPGAGSGPQHQPDFPRAPAFRPPSQDPSALSRAETELLAKVRAVRTGSDSPSGDDAR